MELVSLLLGSEFIKRLPLSLVLLFVVCIVRLSVVIVVGLIVKGLMMLLSSRSGTAQEE